MFKKFFLFPFYLLFGFILFADTPDDVVKKIQWFGQSAFKIETPKAVVFIDPVGVKTPEKADIILVTHSHGDHFSKSDIEKLSKPDTIIIAPFDIDGKNKILLPNNKMDVKGLVIEAVPAYNIVKADRHPKEKNFAGYILTVNGVRVYHAGDTEKIPEMKNFNVDIALLPLGQKYTMNSVSEAVEAAVDLKAKIAIPMHFGQYEGTEVDAKKFVDELTGKRIKALILKRN